MSVLFWRHALLTAGTSCLHSLQYALIALKAALHVHVIDCRADEPQPEAGGAPDE